MKYIIWLIILAGIAAIWYSVGVALLQSIGGGIAFGILGATAGLLTWGVFDGASANSRWEERHGRRK